MAQVVSGGLDASGVDLLLLGHHRARIDAEEPVVLLRPGHLPTEEIEPEAADGRDSLRRGQAPLNRLFRLRPPMS